MTNPAFNPIEFRAIPTFGISDYQTAIDFYIGFLGFKIDWEHRFGQTAPTIRRVSKALYEFVMNVVFVTRV